MSLVSTMEWNLNCFDKAHHSQLVETKRSLKRKLDAKGQGQDQTMANGQIVIPPTRIINEGKMLDYEDDDLQTLMESKEDETQGNTTRRGFFGLSSLVQGKD